MTTQLHQRVSEKHADDPAREPAVARAPDVDVSAAGLERAIVRVERTADELAVTRHADRGDMMRKLLRLGDARENPLGNQLILAGDD